MKRSSIQRMSGAKALLATSLILSGAVLPAQVSQSKKDELPATGWAADKVTISLLQIAEEALQQDRSIKDASAANPLIRQYGDAIQVEVCFEKGAVDVLRTAKIPGTKVLYISDFHDQATVAVSDPQAILALSQLEGVRIVKPNYPAKTNQVGISLSRAPRAHSVDTAIQRFMKDGRVIDGRTQKIGVISDSFSTTEGVRGPGTSPAIGESGVLRGAKNQLSGDLPAEVDIVLDLRSPNAGSDEGAGMAELIHDVAPGAALAFHSAFVSEASFADGIRRLWQEAGCTIVVDDVAYFAEPAFQDGLTAIAAEDAVRNGVSYFSSAGNSYDMAIRFSYRDINSTASETTFPPRGLDFHRWPNGTAFLPLTLPPGFSAPVSVQWNQPYGSILGSSGSEIDMDVYVYSAPDVTSAIYASSRDAQGTTGSPLGDSIELFQLSNPSAQSTTVYLAIDNRDGNLNSIPQSPGQPIVMQIFFNGRMPLSSILASDQGVNPGPSIFGHPLAAGAFSVAAVPWWESPRFAPEKFGETTNIDPEDFTSLGGVFTQFFNNAGLYEPRVAFAPSFAAVDGNNTTFFGSSQLPAELNGYEGVPDNFPNFFGTSASAPNAAAIAALMKDLDPTLSPAQIGEIITSTAVDVTGNRSKVGLDDVTGPGLIDANAAMGVVAARLGIDPIETPAPTPTPVPTATPAARSRSSFSFLDGQEGWRFDSASQSNAFVSPLFRAERDRLVISTTENSNTFGFITSPPFVVGGYESGADVPLTGTSGSSSLFRASFTVSTDVPSTGTSVVPTFRMRTATENFERSDVTIITSANPATLSPTVGDSNLYSVYTTLPASQRRFTSYFDVLNFDPSDAATASFYLERVVVDVLNTASLSDRRTEREYFFATQSEDWKRVEVNGFALPEGGQDEGGLRLGPAGNSNLAYFSFWSSPDSFPTAADLNTSVRNDGKRLYRASFRVISNAPAAKKSQVPTFRLRVNDSSFNYSAYTNIESIDSNSILPLGGSPAEYALYFEGRPEAALAGTPFIFAFDYLLPPGSDNDPAIAITLQSLRVESFLTPP